MDCTQRNKQNLYPLIIQKTPYILLLNAFIRYIQTREK